MMKKTLTIIIVGFIITISIISLRPSKPIDKNLVLAEELMSDRPDSALQVLESVNSNKFNGENKALYALLMTQSLFKNYNFPKSDSLIKIAFDYYIPRNDLLHKAQTYLYNGRVDEIMGRKAEALNNFQEASVAALSIQNYKLLSLIYCRWGIFFMKTSLISDALPKLRKSLEFSYLDNDTIMQIYNLKEMGNVYTLQNKYDIALKYYKQALFLAQHKGIEMYIYIVCKNLSILYKLRKEYTLSMFYFNKSLPFKSDSAFIYSSHYLRGELLILQQKYDSARYYLNLGKRNDLISKATYCSLMSNLEEKVGNFEKALNYSNQYIIYADSFENQTKRSEIAELQKKYDYSLIKNENDNLKISRQQMYIIVLVISFVTMITTFLSLYYFYRKRSIKRAMKLELDKMQQNLINEKSNYLKEKTIEAQRNLIKEQELGLELSQKTEALKHHQERERELKDYIFQMEAIVQKINTFNSMKPLQRSKSESQFTLSFQELNDLEEAVNLCYDHFAHRLRTEYPKLKDDDIYLCCLLKMKVPNKNILSLLDTNELILKKRRYRIKHDKMNLSEDVSSLEEFLLNY